MLYALLSRNVSSLLANEEVDVKPASLLSHCLFKKTTSLTDLYSRVSFPILTLIKTLKLLLGYVENSFDCLLCCSYVIHLCLGLTNLVLKWLLTFEVFIL